MDGEQTCIKIREDENFQTVPILFLSSEVGPEVRIKALDAGANDFISKSCDNHEILARVRNQIQVASLFNALEQRRATPWDPNSTHPTLLQVGRS